MPPQQPPKPRFVQPSNLPPWKLSADPLAHSLSRRAKFFTAEKVPPFFTWPIGFAFRSKRPSGIAASAIMPQETFLGVVGAASCDPGLRRTRIAFWWRENFATTDCAQ